MMCRTHTFFWKIQIISKEILEPAAFLVCAEVFLSKSIVLGSKYDFVCDSGNPRVTPEVTRDVCLLARMMASNLYYSQIEDLMFEVIDIR